MTIRLTQITTHWDADDAHTVIVFIEALRDVLWATYGDEIIEMWQAASESNPGDSDSIDPEFDDKMTF